MRRHPLPDGAQSLIRIAAGSEEAVDAAVAATGYDAGYIRQAAIFYIQQIMLSSGDSYRLIGVRSDADSAEMSENVRWLMKWLHPDSTGSDATAGEARKVLEAWTEIKSPERRQAYDSRRHRAAPQVKRRSPVASRRRPPVIHGVDRVARPRKTLSTRWRAYAATAAVAVVAMAGLLHLLMS